MSIVWTTRTAGTVGCTLSFYSESKSLSTLDVPACYNTKIWNLQNLTTWLLGSLVFIGCAHPNTSSIHFLLLRLSSMMMTSASWLHDLQIRVGREYTRPSSWLSFLRSLFVILESTLELISCITLVTSNYCSSKLLCSNMKICRSSAASCKASNVGN